MEVILKYFPELSALEKERLFALKAIYESWNSKINVISRKDMDEFYIRHVLHSLSISKMIQFKKGSKILDVGTGGGFPGIPLAILNPDADFLLVDSIGKKITVVAHVAEELGLQNVRAQQIRAEEINEKFDFIVSRAVTQVDRFLPWVKNKFNSKSLNDMPNGYFFIKGGDLKEEFKNIKTTYIVKDLKEEFEEEFFETKKLLYMKA